MSNMDDRRFFAGLLLFAAVLIAFAFVTAKVADHYGIALTPRDGRSLLWHMLND